MKKKPCTAGSCGEKISIRHFFCRTHFDCLSGELKQTLMDAYAKGDSRRLMGALEEARQFFRKREENMLANGRSDLIDVELEFRAETEEAMAFFNGDMEERVGATGRRSQREVWQWCPKRLIETEMSETGRSCVVTMPEWLAKERGFI